MRGSELIARTLKDLDVEHVFGIVGIPVIEVAEAFIAHGIQFVSFRNEQSAVYAASIYGFLTGKPGVALVVGGPGVVHALAGVENANSNRSPLLLLAGSSETHQRGQGAFQQLDQVSLVKAAGAKFAEQPPNMSEVPRLIAQAYTVCFYGKPGTSYIDLPADLIQAEQPSAPPNAPGKTPLPARVHRPLPAPRSMGDPDRIREAARLLKSSKSPLLVIGKGCAYARAEESVQRLQLSTNLAFLPTPMGKGVIPDTHARNVSAARSAALKMADVVLVLGARLNWILHFGAPPRWKSDVKFIQVDTVAEELHSATLGILGDAKLVCDQLSEALTGWRAPELNEEVAKKLEVNRLRAEKKEAATKGPLEYQPVYKVIRDVLDSAGQPVIYVSEGANTMDVSRTSFEIDAPRTRLDAGTNATMGVGMGYAIAAKLANPQSLVVALEGDSAFGFSAMEVETAVRTNLPMIIFVMNNSGVYHGTDPQIYGSSKPLPSTALGLQTSYHELAQSLGALGFVARTLEEVKEATSAALRANCVALVNVILDPGKDKELKFGWMSKL